MSLKMKSSEKIMNLSLEAQILDLKHIVLKPNCKTFNYWEMV